MQTQERGSKLIPLITILSGIGVLISIWQTKTYYDTRSGLAAFHSFCNIGQTFDCTAVEISKFAEFFSGFPLSAVALAGYLVIFLLSLFGFSENHRKNLTPYLQFFCSVALTFTIGYLILMVGVIQKLCLLCLCVDAINIALFITALKLPVKQETSNGMTKTHLVGVGIAAMLIAFLFTKGLDPYAEMKKEDVADTIESVLNEQSVQVPIPADAPVIGNPNAPITIVKFSDYECPACKIGATALHPLFKRYPNDVKFVFINYPLDQGCNPNIPRKMHEFACEAAEAAICATEQGKFEDAYETLFENQSSFAQNKIADLLVSKIKGLDEAKLKNCMTLPSTLDKIRRDVDIGGKNQMNITSTPTFYINGKKIEGGLPTTIWIQIIERMLGQKK